MANTPQNNGPRTQMFGGILLKEHASDLPAPPANHVVIYAKDTGAGKTRLFARFSSGAVQTLATEP